MTWCRSSRDLLQRVPDRVERFIGLRPVRAAALGHVGTAAATLAAEGRDCGFDQVDGADLTGEVVGDAYSNTRAALVHRHQNANARAKALLHVVNGSAQVLGVE